MKRILKQLSIAAAMLVLCAGLASCGQSVQAGQSGSEAQTGVEGQTGTTEETTTVVVVLSLRELIVAQRAVSILIVLLAHVAAIAATAAIAQIGIGIEQTARIVDVTAGVPAFLIVGTRLYGAVVACLTVTLQHDVDDARRAFRRIFG